LKSIYFVAVIDGVFCLEACKIQTRDAISYLKFE